MTAAKTKNPTTDPADLTAERDRLKAALPELEAVYGAALVDAPAKADAARDAIDAAKRRIGDVDLMLAAMQKNETARAEAAAAAREAELDVAIAATAERIDKIAQTWLAQVDELEHTSTALEAEVVGLRPIWHERFPGVQPPQPPFNQLRDTLANAAMSREKGTGARVAREGRAQLARWLSRLLRLKD
jgi:hypothetical protein